MGTFQGQAELKALGIDGKISPPVREVLR